MGFGFEIPEPQPGNVNMGMERESVDPMAAFGGAAPQMGAAPAADISPDAPAMSVLPELAGPSPAGAPPGTLDQNILKLQDVRRQKEQEQILAGMGLPEVETRQVEQNISEQELDDQLAQSKELLGENPPQVEEFAGEGESRASQIERFKQSPMQYFKDHFKEQFAAFRAGLGDSDAAKIRGFKGVWNDPETGASTAWKGGKIYIKYPKSNGFVPVGEKKFNVLQNLFLKTMVNASGPIVEGVASVGAASAMTAGATAATIAGHPGAAMAIGAAAPGVEGAAGVLARRGTVKAFDAVYGNNQLTEKESEALAWDTLSAAGINYAMWGMGKFLPRAGEGIKQVVKQGMPEQALQKMDAVNQMWKDYIDKYSKGSATGSLREGAQEVQGVVSDAAGKLIRDVRAVEDVVRQRAGKDTKFSLKNTLNSIQETLENYRATIDPKTGKVSLLEDLEKMSPEDAAILKDMGALEGFPAGGSKGPADFDLATRAGEGRVDAAFGQLGGRKELQKVADLYERLSAIEKTGGADVNTLFNYLDAFNFEGDLDKVITRPGELTNTYRKFRNSAALDRAEAMEQVLNGSGLPEEGLFRTVYSRFQTNIDDHVKILKIFDDQKSVEEFIKRTGRQSETVATVAKVLGTDSPAFARYKGEFLADMVRNSTDPSKGFFNGKKFMEDLYKLPEGARNTLFSKTELKEFQSLARASQTLPYAAFLNKNEKLDAAVLSGIGSGAFLSSRIKFLMWATGRNYEAMDYLVNDAMFDQIRKAGTKEQKAELMAARRYMQEMIDKMQVVKVPRNGKLVKVLVPAARAAVRKTPEVTRSVMDRAGETGLIMYPPEQAEPQI